MRLRLLFAAAVTAACVTPASALAADSTTSLLGQLDEAVAIEETAPAAMNPAVELPSGGSEAAALQLPEGQTLTMGVPGQGDVSRTANTAVFEGAAPDTALAVQSTSGGVRALISIDSASAPERYTFPIGGDVSSLVRETDGGVVALDAGGNAIARLAAPWARDTNGRDVPTHFEIDGTTVVQVVEHRGGGFAYGITADPWWNPFSWNWSKIGRVAARGITRCGGGFLKGALGVGGGVVSVNLIKKGAGTFMIRSAGGPYVYIAAGTAGCINDLL